MPELRSKKSGDCPRQWGVDPARHSWGWDLAVWLRDNVQADQGPEFDAWTLVRTAMAAGDHLEAALENKSLPDTLVVTAAAPGIS